MNPIFKGGASVLVGIAIILGIAFGLALPFNFFM